MIWQLPFNISTRTPTVVVICFRLFSFLCPDNLLKKRHRRFPSFGSVSHPDDLIGSHHRWKHPNPYPLHKEKVFSTKKQQLRKIISVDIMFTSWLTKKILRFVFPLPTLCLLKTPSFNTFTPREWIKQGFVLRSKGKEVFWTGFKFCHISVTTQDRTFLRSSLC